VKFGDEVRYAVRLGVPLSFLHQKPSHGNAATRPQVTRRLIAGTQLDHSPWANHVLGAVGKLALVIYIVGELSLESPDLFLQLDDIVAVDLAALGGVEIFARRAGSLAGQTPWQGWVATSFPLAAHRKLALAALRSTQPAPRRGVETSTRLPREV
jgi:hypothetical protein